MRNSRFGERFFESTRGRVIKLLRGAVSTVNELAAALGLTDNAVRAHLLSLERDGLVRQSGTQRGVRKPHFAYELTPEAEQLFPKAYDVVLNRLISVLKAQLPPEEVEEVLRDVGRSLAGDHAGDTSGEAFESRVARALKVLEAIGGSASVTRDDEKIVIEGRACPLSAAVGEHPEVCRLAEALVGGIVGARVHEQCEREPSARCRFEIPRTAGA